MPPFSLSQVPIARRAHPAAEHERFFAI